MIAIVNGKEYVVYDKDDIKINNNSITFPNNNSYAIVKNVNLSDGTNIKYYGDGSALITKNDDEKLFVRKSGDIILKDNEYISVIVTQDRYYKINEKNIDNGKILIFNNGDAVIKYNDGKMDYVDDVSKIKFDKNGNIAKIEGVLKEEYKNATLVDDTKVIIFNDNSAVIIDKDNNKTYVEDAKNIIYGSDGNISKIDGTTIGVADNRVLPDGSKITEFTNGVIIIEKLNGQYVKVDKNDIVYDKSGNIDYIDREPNSNVGTATLPDGTKVTNFENDKSLVENSDGSSYVCDKNDVIYDEGGNIDSEKPEHPPLEDPDYSFEIPNDTDEDVKYRLVLEETNNYGSFNINALPAKYVKFELLIDGNYVNDRYLNQNIWEIGSPLNKGSKIVNNTYILFEGTIKAHSVAKADLNLWLDYANMGNDMQNRAFIGTLKAYLWQD